MSEETQTPVHDRTITIEIKGSALCGKSTIAVLIARHLASVFEQNGVLVPISVTSDDGDYPKVYSRVHGGAIPNKLAAAFSNLDTVHLVDGKATPYSYIGSALPDLD